MAAKRGVVGSTPNAWTGGRPQSAQPDKGLHSLVQTLIDEYVSASTVNGSTFTGLLVNHNNTPEPSFTLVQAVSTVDPTRTIPTVTIPIAHLVSIQPKPRPKPAQPNPNAKPQSRETFKTDVEVTGQGPFRREKVLQAWGGPGEDEGGLEADKPTQQRQLAGSTGGNGQQWDQFATNERLFGLKTDFDEEMYTTRLDRSGADYRQREARAAQLEREIMKGTGGLGSNAHMAEERGEVVDDSGMDEEDRYGAVIRSSGAYVPPGARKSATATTSRQPTPQNGSAAPSPAPAPAPAPAEAPPASTTTTTANAAASAAARQADPAILSTSRMPSFINKAGAGAGAGAAAVAGAGLPAIKREPPALHATFSQFVTTEKERLQQKRQAAVNNAVKKEHDSKLASLLKFSQEFKLPTPVPEDISNLLGKKTPAASAANTPVASPNARARALAAAPSPAPAAAAAAVTTAAPAAAKAGPKVSLPKPTGPPRLSGLASIGIAEIPPFNPNKNKSPSPVPAPAPAAAPAAPSTSAAAPATATPALAPKPASTKFNAAAPAFVFKPNPAAASFTPSFGGAPALGRKPSDTGSAASAAVAIKPPTASPAAQPSAFFIKPIKKGSPSMRVKEDFTPFKNTHIPDPAQIAPTWGAFTGKSYRAMWPPAHGPPEEDPNLAGAVHHLPPGPPGGFNPYQQYQPPNFQPQQPQQQRFPQPGPLQGQPQPPQLPPHMAGPPINGGFQHFQGMAFPQPGVPPHGQPMFSPQQMAAGQAGVAPPGQFIRYPQFPPQQAQPGQQGAVPMGYVEGGPGRM